MLEAVLSSPLVPQVAALIEKRLGRPLEPFDVWYDGFRPRGAHTEEQLDAIVAQALSRRAEAYKADIPNLLVQLGFSKEKARVPRGAHRRRPRARLRPRPAARSGARDQPHLRTRVEKDGMNYKGFNIAVHEMGHNVEQTFSLNDVDSHAAAGRAQHRVHRGARLRLPGARPRAARPRQARRRRRQACKTLNDFWATYEIAGVALVDMGVWHWMYDHPNATPAQLKDATLADLPRRLEQVLRAGLQEAGRRAPLGIYSHMIDAFLYLPDYPIGHLIAFQIEQQIAEVAGNLGPEFERMAKFGNVAPDLWMKQATGAPVGAAGPARGDGKGADDGGEVIMGNDQDDTAELPVQREAEAREPAGASSRVAVDVAALSHQGKVRKNNEDHFIVARFDRTMRTLLTNLPAGDAPDRYAETVYGMLVADGVGGAAAGEIASRTAITAIMDLVIETPDWIMRLDDPLAQEVLKRMEDRFQKVRDVLVGAREEGPDASAAWPPR